MLHKSYLVVLLIIYCDIIQSCPNGFFRASDDTCLHIGRPSLDSMESYCKKRGSHPFSRPLTDEISSNLAKEMMRVSEEWMPIAGYLGMKNKAEDDPWANSGNWYFEGEPGKDFRAEDYEWWYRLPEDDENCAVSSIKSDFKALPSQCNVQIAAVCEKEEKPCYDSEVTYMEYQGLCLTVIQEYSIYSAAKDECKKGRLMRLKTEANIQSIYQAFYNMIFAGGVYIGLKKSGGPNYEYESGDAEVNGWAGDDVKAFDCAGVRIVKDNTLGLYTIPCNKERLFFLCEIRKEEGEDEADSEKKRTFLHMV